MGIRGELNEINFKFKKSFGQNFITDKNLLSAIVFHSNINKDDTVLEIGPGAGTLTEEISKQAKKVVSYEIDRDLIDYLNNKFKNTNVKIINKDILKASNEEIEKELETSNYKIVANLPYYITTPIIMKFVESDNIPKSISIMVQKEVGDRLVAKPGNKDYGSITASIALYCTCKNILNVSRQMFMPQPDVDSCVILIEKKNITEKISTLRNTQKIIHSAFLRRRKTLINNLMQDFNLERQYLNDIFEQLNIDVKIRGEMLSPEEFILLAKKIFNE